MVRRAALFFIALLGVVVRCGVTLLALMASQGGNRWLIRQALTHTEGILTVGGVRGGLLRRLELTDIDYAFAQSRGHVDRVALDWRPVRLLGGRSMCALFISMANHVQTDETEGQFEPPRARPCPCGARCIIRGSMVPRSSGGRSTLRWTP
jgi:hypothetical protein